MVSEARKQYLKEYYKQHREEILARKKEQYANDEDFRKNRILASQVYQMENREEFLKQKKEYRRKNRDKLHEKFANYYEKNKEDISKKRKEKRNEEKIITAEG